MKKFPLLMLCVMAFAPALFAKAKAAKIVKADSASYADYYGKYKFDAGSQVDEADIIWRDGSLTISTGMGDAQLDKELGTDSFHMTYEDGIIVFKRGDDKKVTGMKVIVSGNEINAVKQPPATTFIRKQDILNEGKEVAVK